MLLTRSPLEYPASRAFPFDLHVLSTPPAFVLSQDQTLHKKISEQKSETGREKPETQQKNKPPQTTQQCSLCWRPKNYYKEKYSPLNPTGSKMRKPQKLNTITCQPIHLNAAETPNSIQKRYVFHIPNRHTPTNKPPRPAGRQTNQHTTMHTKNKKYIGTLLSSQTSSAHLKKINFPLTSRWRLVQTYPTK